MKFFTTLFFICVFSISVKAQEAIHEVGVFLGTGAIQTDFGQRNDFFSSYGNNVISFSATHYIQFYSQELKVSDRYHWKKHFMLKSEINIFTRANFEHFGKYTEGSSVSAQKLSAMKGHASVMSIGVSAEYYLRSLYNDVLWNPFVTLGFKYSWYNNGLESDLGDWRTDITVLPGKYQTPNALNVGRGSTPTIALGAGTRLRLTSRLDLAGIFNWHIYFSDTVDGLQADVPENRNDEWMTNIQVGLIYDLRSSAKSKAYCF
ncbi:hypothetical protein GCM10011416_05150 [Polaribacter pacificus]|uniref:Outer membrane protein beta-barrel domain-containing protein n=1 Tax=Polaribacter pacificus TaxID=1775173 RepID=A0A917MC40_9FLAO|nr:hypothetical protein [Polaribacter pacificus]GGG91476.1 hypothetical protein GCM10011416_05150 [Polaribacter pacificus]